MLWVAAAQGRLEDTQSLLLWKVESNHRILPAPAQRSSTLTIPTRVARTACVTNVFHIESSRQVCYPEWSRSSRESNSSITHSPEQGGLNTRSRASISATSTLVLVSHKRSMTRTSRPPQPSGERLLLRSQRPGRNLHEKLAFARKSPVTGPRRTHWRAAACGGDAGNVVHQVHRVRTSPPAHREVRLEVLVAHTSGGLSLGLSILDGC